MPQTVPPKQREKSRARDRMNRSLEAAIEEANRDGYVSADEGRRRANEVLKRIDKRAAAGQIKP